MILILILLVLIGLCYALTIFLNILTIACSLTTKAIEKLNKDLNQR